MVNSLAACQIIKTTNRFVIGTAVMAVACTSIALTPATADAVIRDYSCSKGGFTGTLKIDYNQGLGGRIGSIIRINYKINKGNNRGGNKANVTYVDNGNLPATVFKTGDAGIQDNKWRYLGGSYSRGSGNIYVKFIFDKSFASDPSCKVDISRY
ncbi:hypothetical protein [Nostoc sp. DedQUE09]|uniref:hypothetical protein n=1 Tax=Nostoc sp. DedQUE09 TaxID=3075394 RepID=UPI002AD3E112|nr:hypothetical protein [Nostoc sp. DedQUE09]MDZ7950411.1 hypothetical protein [Nostoc sp. DedQUE09]